MNILRRQGNVIGALKTNQEIKRKKLIVTVKTIKTKISTVSIKLIIAQDALIY